MPRFLPAQVQQLIRGIARAALFGLIPIGTLLLVIAGSVRVPGAEQQLDMFYCWDSHFIGEDCEGACDMPGGGGYECSNTETYRYCTFGGGFDCCNQLTFQACGTQVDCSTGMTNGDLCFQSFSSCEPCDD